MVPSISSYRARVRAGLANSGLRVRAGTLALVLAVAACSGEGADEQRSQRGDVAPAAGAPSADTGLTPRPVPDTAPGKTPDAAAPPAAGDRAGDSASIARLEREARGLAKADGCTSGSCRVAPLGAKACGGPRTYLAYCALTTDSAALFRKLDELRSAEAAYNGKHGVVSDCSVAVEPVAEVNKAGRCVVP